MSIHYATNAQKNGRYEWRCIVIDFFLGGRCTKYQFRYADYETKHDWCNQEEWPKFNGNDTYLGLPKSLEKSTTPAIHLSAHTWMG